MRKSRKILSLLLALVMVFALSSCAGTDSPAKPSTGGTTAIPAGEKATLHLWHLWTTETDAMRIETQNAIEDYMAEHENVEIEVHILENEAYKTKISTEFAGSASGIDMFFYWGGGRGGKLQQAGKILAVEDYLTAEQLATVKPGAGQQFTYDGKLYALPTYSWMMPLYVNTELFETAGAKIPTTYEELVDAVEKLKASGVEYPIAMGIKEGWQAAFVYESIALRLVGAQNELAMLNGEVPFDDPGYLEAAQKAKELFDMGAFGKNPMEISTPDSDQLFLTGKAAMRLQGNWFTEAIYVDKNSVVSEVSQAVPFPMIGDSSLEDYCGGYIDSIFINANTQYPEIAADFNIYLNKRLAKVRHETGQGFTGFTDAVDESGLSPVALEVAAMSASTVNGVIAWDTALDENTAATHLDEVQSLFTNSGDPQAVFDAHAEAINNR